MLSKPYKILIVDDEKEICDLLTTMISNYPMRNSLKVLTTESPVNAREILAEEDVSILVTDLNMPGVHGLDLINITQENHKNTTIIAMTGVPQKTTAMSLFSEGIFLMIDKPAQIDIFYQALDLALGRLQFWDDYFGNAL